MAVFMFVTSSDALSARFTQTIPALSAFFTASCRSVLLTDASARGCFLFGVDR